MFKVVLDERMCKDASTVRKSGYLPYLLDSAIEWSIALLRACNNCEMSKPPAGCPSVSSFIAGVAGLEKGSIPDFAGRLKEGSLPQGTLYVQRADIYISDERPLLHPRRRSFRRSLVTGEWNGMLYLDGEGANRISRKPRNLTGTCAKSGVRDGKDP